MMKMIARGARAVLNGTAPCAPRIRRPGRSGSSGFPGCLGLFLVLDEFGLDLLERGHFLKRTLSSPVRVVRIFHLTPGVNSCLRALTRPPGLFVFFPVARRPDG